MPDPVYQVMTLLCALVAPLPIGTNLGLLHLLWLLVSGRLLASRGALFPALAECGLAEGAIRRAWAALGQGGWTGAALLARWAALLHAAGRWQPRAHAGYHPVAVDLTGFWRVLAGVLIRACTQAIERRARQETAPMSKPANTGGREVQADAREIGQPGRQAGQEHLLPARGPRLLGLALVNP